MFSFVSQQTKKKKKTASCASLKSNVWRFNAPLHLIWFRVLVATQEISQMDSAGVRRIAYSSHSLSFCFYLFIYSSEYLVSPSHHITIWALGNNTFPKLLLLPFTSVLLFKYFMQFLGIWRRASRPNNKKPPAIDIIFFLLSIFFF